MGRREENKARKRAKLEDEGLRLFLETGYDRTSIEQIAAASDVARGTFYLYFPDKLTLFETLADRFYEPVLELMQQIGGQLEQANSREECFAVYQGMAQGLAMIGLTHAGLLLLAFREVRRVGEAGEALRNRENALLEAAEGLTRTAVARELITAGHPRLTTLIIFGAVEKLIYEFLEGNDIGDPEAVATDVMHVFGRALDLPTPKA